MADPDSSPKEVEVDNARDEEGEVCRKQRKSRRKTEESDVTHDSTKLRRKKKKKRRPTPSGSEDNGVSDSDVSDVEAGHVKRGSRRKSRVKTPPPSEEGGSNDTPGNGDTAIDGGELKDSMLVRIKSKRLEKAKLAAQANEETGSRRQNLTKGVSFSNSTVEREVKKQGSLTRLEMAMGKMPTESDAALKEGNGDGERKATFAVDEPVWRVSPAEDDPAVATSAANNGPRKKRPSFTPVEYGSDEDDGKGTEAPPIAYKPRRTSAQSSSTSTLIGSLQRNRSRPQAGSGEEEGKNLGRQQSWQPDAIGGSQPTQNPRRIRRNTTDSEELRSSLTAQRPGIQRRNSMNNSLVVGPKKKRLSFDLESDNGEERGRSSVLSRHRKAMRRMRMSVQDQTYIPPKSRQTSIFQAVAHLMAGRMVDLTLWSYQASFVKVMLFFLAFYAVNIFVWAGILHAVDMGTGGVCIHDNPEELSGKERYEFVVELSWATFTTVGYGTVSPQGDVTGCYAVRLTCALVAFVGVLFASQTAAIMYSKLMRLLAHAHVTFSSTLCVQYGKGNEGSTIRFGQLNFRASVAPSMLKAVSERDLLDASEKEDESTPDPEDGFPVIEFRMINDRANHEGSEIWDAQIRAIVQLRKEQPSEIEDMLKDKDIGGESTLDLEKKVYYPISLSPDAHPHFSRIWYARHVLNAESPLLKREVRDMIVRDGGKWDKDLNHWDEIRDCLNPFISLRITLSGTSAVSASNVYIDHVYEFDDVCVGWRFANMVYEKKERQSWFGRKTNEEESQADAADTRTKIDAALLHDIVPQPGGDHEPLNETTHSPTYLFPLFRLLRRQSADDGSVQK